MLFSNAQGSADNPALNQVATLLPMPEPSGLALMTRGLDDRGVTSSSPRLRGERA
jgi:hypothetical protein